jgi:hypothetical protein
LSIFYLSPPYHQLESALTQIHPKQDTATKTHKKRDMGRVWENWSERVGAAGERERERNGEREEREREREKEMGERRWSERARVLTPTQAL